MKNVTALLVILALSASLAACGVKGDPEPPPATEKMQ
jgi:predicted small lipoprotein YifL